VEPPVPASRRAFITAAVKAGSLGAAAAWVAPKLTSVAYAGDLTGSEAPTGTTGGPPWSESASSTTSSSTSSSTSTTTTRPKETCPPKYDPKAKYPMGKEPDCSCPPTGKKDKKASAGSRNP
jgi:hypothetical protein